MIGSSRSESSQVLNTLKLNVTWLSKFYYGLLARLSVFVAGNMVRFVTV